MTRPEELVDFATSSRWLCFGKIIRRGEAGLIGKSSGFTVESAKAHAGTAVNLAICRPTGGSFEDVLC
jgi:hypothetical protein